MARNGHARPATKCPFLRVKPTSRTPFLTSVHDPKRTLGSFTASRSIKNYYFPKIVSDNAEKHIFDLSAERA